MSESYPVPEKGNQGGDSVFSAASSPGVADDVIRRLEQQNSDLRARVSDLEKAMCVANAASERKIQSLENRVQVVKQMISFQLGAAILEAFQSPARLLSLPAKLWKIHLDAEGRREIQEQRREISLRGKKYRALFEILQNEGIPAVKNQLEQLVQSPALVAGTLGTMARELTAESPQLAIGLVRAAQEVDARPYRAKWLALRLFNLGHLAEPSRLLEGITELSPSEKKCVEELGVLRALQTNLPEIPRKQAVSHAPVDGSILYVAASALPYHTSGYATRTHELLLALKNSGAKVVAVTRMGYPWDRKDRLGNPLAQRAQQADELESDEDPHLLRTNFDGIEYLHRKSPSMNLPLDIYIQDSARIIAGIAKQRKVAAIHAASNYVNALPALIAARTQGIPFAYEMRGLWNLSRASKIKGYDQSEQFQLEMDLEALVAKNADKVYVISNPLGRLVKSWGVDEARIALLPNCVNLATIERAKKASKEKLKGFTIGYAGSLVPYEGLDLLIKAIAELKDRKVKIHAKIIGDGPSRVSLENLAGKLHVADRVEFLGKQSPDAARSLLAQTHTVVLPRRKERVCQLIPPIKLAEAIALDLPVIVSNLDALVEEIQGVPGTRIFAAGSVKDLSDCIEQEVKAVSNHRAADVRPGKEAAGVARRWSDFTPMLLSVANLG